MSGERPGPTRRSVLRASLVALTPLAACRPAEVSRYEGGWLGVAHERGHLLRDDVLATKSGALPEAALTRRVGALVVGAGI
ncbi:MAG: hypothetical protein ACXWJA_16650, partial [Caldimonas sp.]